ncbi:hypothetical protein J5N97_004388 [Dioscorea zingiberensis]|uniref:DOG1 domain-containing protein n=1 Tax=Dioscorea zingiberensis TaxID=325984 RepID=A0A9D5D7S0_9LILI|nr:hypothetical protein J5N97_004388 [Dioscorea zingiberensis]
MMARRDDPMRNCFNEWATQQEEDMHELRLATTRNNRDDAELRALVAKSIRRYEDYTEKRRSIAMEGAMTLFCPSWCSTFESSFLWLGGCRPSMAIRLVYSVTGAELHAHVNHLFSGGPPPRIGMAALSSSQLASVNELHGKTIRDEDELSTKMASLQEDVVDKPLFQLVREMGEGSSVTAAGGVANGGGARVADGNGEVEAVMQKYVESLAEILEEADRMRVETLGELVTEILTPAQAAELLLAAKQLHLTIQQWGGRRDIQLGLNRQ